MGQAVKKEERRITAINLHAPENSCEFPTVQVCYSDGTKSSFTTTGAGGYTADMLADEVAAIYLRDVSQDEAQLKIWKEILRGKLREWERYVHS